MNALHGMARGLAQIVLCMWKQRHLHGRLCLFSFPVPGHARAHATGRNRTIGASRGGMLGTTLGYS